MKFLCDQMLGTLAKWLRIYGFDTFFADSEVDDGILLNIAKKEKRILITRDKELIQRCEKQKINCINIITTNLDEQIQTVLKNIKIDEKQILSRCSICNNILENIDKSYVKNHVPKNIFENNEKFWYCSKCKKYYWVGSHYINMKNKIKNL